jgi:repressor LexA
MGITKKQKEVFDYIAEYSLVNSFAPTQKEIKDHFDFKSFGSVQRYIKYLADAGYIETDWNARRGITLLGGLGDSSSEVDNYPAGPSVSSRQTVDSNSIPLLGSIAAGNPIEAIESASDMIDVPSYMIKSQSARHFALNIDGDSMIEDGILHGDIVVCRQQEDASRGETVVAVIEGEATLKHYYPVGQSIELRPANKDYQAIVVDKNSGDFSIAGIMVGLLRSYI